MKSVGVCSSTGRNASRLQRYRGLLATLSCECGCRLRVNRPESLSWEACEPDPILENEPSTARCDHGTLAGLSLERVGDYVGHSSAWMTDKYRHLLEGHEAEAARMLDEYLARANTATRLEQLKDD